MYMSTATASKIGMRASNYLISPRDLAEWVQGLRRRDAVGLVLMVVVAVVAGLWLQDPGAGLFAAGLLLAIWWHVDSRWAFGAALVLLILIPFMQFSYDHNWLYSGSSLAGGMAVAVWYLLAIGVVRAMAELRRAPETAIGLAGGSTGGRVTRAPLEPISRRRPPPV
jgi:hypothetical protein